MFRSFPSLTDVGSHNKINSFLHEMESYELYMSLLNTRFRTSPRMRLTVVVQRYKIKRFFTITIRFVFTILQISKDALNIKDKVAYYSKKSFQISAFC